MTKRILITGANRGVGLAIAQSLLASGNAVVALNRSPGRVEGLHEVRCDLRRIFKLELLVDDAVRLLGGLDICILNAAVRRFAWIQDMALKEWQESVAVNLTANFVIAKCVLQNLIDSKGILLVIGSQASDVGFEGGAAYCATKAALKALAGVLMMETRDHGVRTILVTPGAISNRRKENDDWKITPYELASVVSKLIDIPSSLLVSEIEVRPTRTLKSEAIGIERMHRI